MKNTEGTQFGYDTGHSSPELEDAIRREVLRNRLIGYMSSREVNGRLLLPEHANLSDAKKNSGSGPFGRTAAVEYGHEH